MPKCNLKIELDSAAETCLGGQPISGRVIVETDELCETKGVALSLGYFTHGRGNRFSKELETLTLYSGSLQGVQSFPFKLTPPNGPATYHGEIVSLDWQLQARVDLPWKLDPKANLPLTLAPNPDAPYVSGNDTGVQQAARVVHQLGKFAGCALVFLVPFFAAGLWMLWNAFSEPFPYIIMGPMFLGVPSVMAFLLLRNSIAEKKLGGVELTVDPEQVRPGESAQVILRFTPQSELRCNHIALVLRCYERAVSGSGTREQTHRHELYKQPVPLCDARTLHRGEPIELDATITLPATLPPTLALPANAVCTEIEVRVDIPRWPDWVQTLPVWVTPGKRA